MSINIYSKKNIYISIGIFVASLFGLILSSPLNFNSAITNSIAAVSVVSFYFIIIPLTRKKYDALNKIEKEIRNNLKNK